MRVSVPLVLGRAFFDGKVISCISIPLDDVSDGRLNYCETVVDLRNETISMTFYPF